MIKPLRLIFLAMVLATPGASQVEFRPPTDSTEILVRPTELDVKGHVNNAKWVEYLQWGRWEWLDRHGVGNERLAELGTTFVVAKLTVEYRAEARLGDKLHVSTSVLRLGDKSLTVSQVIHNATGEVAVEAQVVLVSVNVASHKSQPLPAEVRKALGGEG